VSVEREGGMDPVRFADPTSSWVQLVGLARQATNVGWISKLAPSA